MICKKLSLSGGLKSLLAAAPLSHFSIAGWIFTQKSSTCKLMNISSTVTGLRKDTPAALERRKRRMWCSFYFVAFWQFCSGWASIANEFHVVSHHWSGRRLELFFSLQNCKMHHKGKAGAGELLRTRCHSAKLLVYLFSMTCFSLLVTCQSQLQSSTMTTATTMNATTSWYR